MTDVREWPPITRRLLALALLLAAIGAIAALALGPVGDRFRDQSAEIERLENIHRDHLAGGADTPELERQLAALTSDPDWRVMAFEADNASDARLRFEGRIRELAREAGVEISVLDPLEGDSAEAVETLPVVGARLEVIATQPALADFLEDLHANNPLIRMQTLNLRREEARDDGGETRLMSAFDLHAFWVTPETAL